MRKIVLLAVVALIVIGLGMWIGVRVRGPAGALADSDKSPVMMMTGAKGGLRRITTTTISWSIEKPRAHLRTSSGSLAMFTADSCKTAPGGLTCWGWMPGAALDLVRTKPSGQNSALENVIGWLKSDTHISA